MQRTAKMEFSILIQCAINVSYVQQVLGEPVTVMTLRLASSCQTGRLHHGLSKQLELVLHASRCAYDEVLIPSIVVELVTVIVGGLTDPGGTASDARTAILPRNSYCARSANIVLTAHADEQAPFLSWAGG